MNSLKSKNLKRRGQRKRAQKRKIAEEDSRPWWPVELLQSKMCVSDAAIRVIAHGDAFMASLVCSKGLTHQVPGTTEKRAKHNVAAVCLDECFGIPFTAYFDATRSVAYLNQEPFVATVSLKQPVNFPIVNRI
jgi:hypothetical protein